MQVASPQAQLQKRAPQIVRRHANLPPGPWWEGLLVPFAILAGSFTTSISSGSNQSSTELYKLEQGFIERSMS